TAKSAPASAVAEAVRALAETVLHAMYLAKLKMAAAVVAGVLLVTGTGAITYQVLAHKSAAPVAVAQDSENQPVQQGAAILVDLTTRSMTVTRPGTAGAASLTPYALAPEVKVTIDNKEARLLDLPPRFTGSVTLALEAEKVVEVVVVGVTLEGTLTAVQASDQ